MSSKKYSIHKAPLTDQIQPDVFFDSTDAFFISASKTKSQTFEFGLTILKRAAAFQSGTAFATSIR
ncbi:MAG TPA: hypothetical protein DDZ90_08530 [Planctomycetaceae bacterium]|nr:hypothetical protein [Planctomycetaceae bacterium]